MLEAVQHYIQLLTVSAILSMIAKFYHNVLITNGISVDRHFTPTERRLSGVRVCERMEPSGGAVGGVSNPPVAPYGNMMPQVRCVSHHLCYDQFASLCAGYMYVR